MYHYIALIEAEKQTRAQFRDAPQAERLVVERDRRTRLATPLRLRISTAIFALANLIDPGTATPDTGHAR